MIKAFFYFGLAAFVSVLSVPALADTTTDQISAALKAENFSAAQQLIDSNPDKADSITQALLAVVKVNLISKPDTASQAMTMAANLAPKASNAIAPLLASLLQDISSQSLASCNADESSRPNLRDDEREALSQSLLSVMNGAQTIAQLPSIVTAKPGLYAQVKSDSDKCFVSDEDALLAQTPPGFNLRVLPFGQNPLPATAQPSAQ